MDVVAEDYFEMRLQCQEQVRDIHICILILPNLYIEGMLSEAIDIAPHLKRSFSVAEHNV